MLGAAARSRVGVVKVRQKRLVSAENMVDGGIIGTSVVRRVDDAAVALRAHGG